MWQKLQKKLYSKQQIQFEVQHVFLTDMTLDDWFWEEKTYTLTWYEEKTDLEHLWRFQRTNKN